MTTSSDPAQSCSGMTAGGRCARRLGHDGRHATIGAVYLDEIDRVRVDHERLHAALRLIASGRAADPVALAREVLT